MSIFSKHAFEAFVADPRRNAVRPTTGPVNYDLDGNFRRVTAALKEAVNLQKLAAQPTPPSNLTGLLGAFLQGIGGHGMFPNGSPAPAGHQYASNQGGQLLTQALGGLMSGAVRAPADALGERITSALGFSKPLGERKDLLGMASTGVAQGASKAVGEAVGNLFTDIANKAVAAAGNAMDAGARNAVLEKLRATDPVLSDRSDAELMEAYHTMVNVAPTLSKDINAVRSFLREAVMSGAGPSYVTIRGLADAEKAVIQARTGGR